MLTFSGLYIKMVRGQFICIFSSSQGQTVLLLHYIMHKSICVSQSKHYFHLTVHSFYVFDDFMNGNHVYKSST